LSFPNFLGDEDGENLYAVPKAGVKTIFQKKRLVDELSLSEEKEAPQHAA